MYIGGGHVSFKGRENLDGDTAVSVRR